MPSTDLVSVIVPVYRTEAYLNECVSSILSQTYAHIEVILVDDGSDDASPLLCDQWAATDPRVRVIHQVNLGLSAARNRGLARAYGGFVAFVDSDDVVAPDLVERLRSLAMKHGADIVGCDLAPFEDDDRPVFTDDAEEIAASGVHVLLRFMRDGRNWEACAKLFRTAVFEGGNRFREGVLFEDLELIPRLYASAQVAVHTRTRLYGYRRRLDSIMGGSRRRLSPDLITVLQSNIDFVDERFDRGTSEHSLLIAALLLHAASKLEQMSLASARRDNAAYAGAYRRFMRRHLGRVLFSRDISRPYRLAMALSSVSPQAFLVAVNIARYVKAHLLPSLRRRSGGPANGWT